MYAKVTATQSPLVTDPDRHRYVAVPHAKNFLDINLSVCLSKNAFTRAIVFPLVQIALVVVIQVAFQYFV